MIGKHINRYRLLLYALLAYMLAAFIWWAILLSKNNAENYALKKSLSSYDKTLTEPEITETYETKKKMIIGEGIVFGVSLLLGLYLIHKAYWNEIKNNQKQNNFLLSITHELKTPIASLNLINRTLANKDISKEKTNQLLDSAYSESKRLESLVDNILTVAQMEQKYDYNFESVDLTELIKHQCVRYEILFSREIILSSAKNITAKVDPEAFTKLIENLLSNAIKYSGKNHTVEVSLTKNDNRVILKVTDQGKGIPSPEKKRVLDKFYRLGNEETRDTKGTGLGLFIVKEIVNAHQGSIDIKDNTPQGSIFEIKLPIQ